MNEKTLDTEIAKLVRPENLQFTRSQVSCFCFATLDYNKIHQGSNPVVPAFLLEFAVKRVLDERLRSELGDNGLNFSSLTANFRKKVYASSEHILDFEHIPDADDYSFRFTISSFKDNAIAVKGTIHYASELNRAPDHRTSDRMRSANMPIGYNLNGGNLQPVRFALGAQRDDRTATAVSLSSNALWRDFTHLLQKEDQQPVYLAHNISAYDSAEQLFREGRFCLCSKEDLSNKNKLKRGIHTAYLRGLDTELETPLFDAELQIAFEPKHK